MTPSAGITELINEARRHAIDAIGAVEATQVNLELLSTMIWGAIMTQVVLGRWAEWGVTEVAEMTSLVVKARLHDTAYKAPIIVDYDFKNTKLRLLQVKSAVIL